MAPGTAVRVLPEHDEYFGSMTGIITQERDTENVVLLSVGYEIKELAFTDDELEEI